MAAVQRAIADASIRQRLRDAGLELTTSSTAEFEALIARDTEAWDARVAEGLIKPA